MTFLLGIIGLGFLVFFHELGHFIAARISGVKVEAFSVGMGPILLHHTIKDTDYRLSLIPLGGYCAMKGEQDFRNALDSNLKTIEGSDDSFYGVHPLKRLLIAFAGPFFNYFFGFLAFFLIALIGYTYYSAGTKVSMADEIYPELHSAAHEAGMESGDIIKKINGTEVSDFAEIASFVATHPDEELLFTVDRNGTLIEIVIHSDLDKETGSGKVGIVSDKDSIVERVHERKNMAEAAKEGIVESLKVIQLTFKSIRILFKGIKVQNAVSGPVRITSMLGTTVQQGFNAGIKAGIVSTLEFLAMISISLFLTNLLPVPILDGGLILFAFIEWLSGKKLSPKVLYYIQMAGIGIIAVLMMFALFGDIMYFMKK
ncbi:M50 family metallopeptidase [Treponema sp.]|uniref:M50 family metallopeptidase n=1 Tax=Treponema sp. TaxID=166 RepID=UPI003890D36B